jgi:hypothetical protein
MEIGVPRSSSLARRVLGTPWRVPSQAFDRCRHAGASALAALILGVAALHTHAAAAQAVSGDRVTCSSEARSRTSCAANTSAGVVLTKSTGTVPCLLGKSWGYDDYGVWVSDGCSAEFLTAQLGAEGAIKPADEKAKGSPEYVPNAGFRLYEGDNGEIYMRLFTYVRYLNQKGLDPSYTDYFGNTHDVKQRQDTQLNKFFLPFSGWFMSPNFRYYLYVWSTNASQGEPAQVVGAGNISYVFNRFVTLGGGITSLPSTRSTEGQFPYWLGVDDRIVSDEFFRGSYTTGVWVKGEITARLKYMAMIANNLSTLGVSAAKIDNKMDTTSVSLQWLPTTGEFGLYGTFGDYDYHEQLATRLGVHYTQSTEDKQSQPGTEGVENSQIRLTDGSNVFTANLFAPGVAVNQVHYAMSSLDGGIKYHGLSLEAEYYWRTLSEFEGVNTGGIGTINDHGYQVQASAMAIRNVLQAYVGAGEIRGHYGDGSEFRVGLNWYPMKRRGTRVNGEWMNLNHVPVGYTAVPYPVGGNGDVFHINVEMNF